MGASCKDLREALGEANLIMFRKVHIQIALGTMLYEQDMNPVLPTGRHVELSI